MKNLKQHKLLVLVLILAYMLNACSGAPAGVGGQPPQNDQSRDVVFSGTVEAIDAGQWTVSGQAISLSATTSVDANIQVGDNVTVEATVGQDGVVTAVRIESTGADDAADVNSNDNSANAANLNDSNANDSNDNASNSNESQSDNSNSANGNVNANGNDNGNDNGAPVGPEQEVSGTVQAITTDSITINGVLYLITNFTEFKDLVAVGDAVKVHVIVNPDGTLTIREIEKSQGVGIGDNSNSNGSDDHGNANDDDSNHNGDDDNGGHGNDNGNDDSHDNGSGSNSNG